MKQSNMIYSFGRVSGAPLALVLPAGRYPYAYLEGRPMKFWGNHELLSQTDAPLADQGPLVVSRRVFEVLTSLGMGGCFTAIEVIVRKDWVGNNPPPWGKKGSPSLGSIARSAVIEGEFFGIYNVEAIECLDWSKLPQGSRHMGSPLKLGVVRPKDDFPPLFGMVGSTGPAYWVREDTKRVLEQAGVVGIGYRFAVPIT